jgi:hypothetical protein
LPVRRWIGERVCAASSVLRIPGVAFCLQAGGIAPADAHHKQEAAMIGGYEDLRNEVCGILGGEVTSEDVDVAVEAIVHEEGLTATTALMELNVLAQTENGRNTLRNELARWIMHERDLSDERRAQRAQLALTHLLQALGAERRHEGARPS